MPDDALVSRDANGTPLEAALGRRLPTHPNLVRVRAAAHAAPPPGPHDSAGSVEVDGPGVAAAGGGGATWLVLDFADGGTLRDAAERGVLAAAPGVSADGGGADAASLVAPAVLAALAADVAAGLAALHAAGVAHGDLTSTNVLLASGRADGESGAAAAPPLTAPPFPWTARISDYGLAAPVAGPAPASAPPYGTVTHMPPEALAGGGAGARGPTPAGDVWAYGVLLWEAAHGCRAWASMTHAQVVAAVSVRGTRLAWSPRAPRWAASLAAACWADDPASRPTAADLVAAVAAAGDGGAAAAAA